MPTLLPRDPPGRGPAITRARHRTAFHPTVQGDNRERSALGIREGGRTSSTAAATAVLSFVLVRRGLSRAVIGTRGGGSGGVAACTTRRLVRVPDVPER